MSFIPHASDRVARLILWALTFDRDPRTLAMWARGVGMSVTRLRVACRAANVSASDAHHLARLLRASLLKEEHQCRWEEVLDIADEDTQRKFLQRGGVRGDGAIAPDVLLDRQTFVAEALVLARIRERLGGGRSRKRG